ncbi:MAG: hypothetical protein MJZ98_00615 [Paludibacteraceae bacterium]|nr:hypothetical protein [Paludibacteraceae bacterium]
MTNKEFISKCDALAEKYLVQQIGLNMGEDHSVSIFCHDCMRSFVGNRYATITKDGNEYHVQLYRFDEEKEFESLDEALKIVEEEIIKRQELENKQ